MTFSSNLIDNFYMSPPPSLRPLLVHLHGVMEYTAEILLLLRLLPALETVPIEEAAGEGKVALHLNQLGYGRKIEDDRQHQPHTKPNP